MPRTYENTAFKRQMCMEKLEDIAQNLSLLRAKVGAILRPVIGDSKWFAGSYVCPATWDCEQSPIGWCVYNEYVDRTHDNCVFCGQAEERK